MSTTVLKRQSVATHAHPLFSLYHQNKFLRVSATAHILLVVNDVTSVSPDILDTLSAQTLALIHPQAAVHIQVPSHASTERIVNVIVNLNTKASFVTSVVMVIRTILCVKMPVLFVM